MRTTAIAIWVIMLALLAADLATAQVQVPGYPRDMSVLADSQIHKSVNWRAAGGLELSEVARPGFHASVGYERDRWGWMGMGTGSSEKLSRFRAIPYHVDGDEVIRPAYGLYTGPSVRLGTAGDADLTCRGLGGVIYRERDSGGFWRVSARAGCGVRYRLDSASSLNVGLDYLFASPALHIPVFSVGYGVTW